MIDTVLNLLFDCPHRHLTRPFTPVNHGGLTHGETYVVCLDCAKQFAYDLTTMRIIDHSHEAFVVHPAMPHPHNTKLKYALVGASVPLALLLASRLVGRIVKRERGIRPLASSKIAFRRKLIFLARRDESKTKVFGSAWPKCRCSRISSCYPPACRSARGYAPPCLVLPAGSDFSNEEREGVLPIPIRLLASVNFYTVFVVIAEGRGQTAKSKLEVVLRRVADP